MCRGHTALIESERLYDDINMEDGPLKHRHRKALAAIRSEGGAGQVRLALARELGSQGER
jgi:hypothetical protein